MYETIKRMLHLDSAPRRRPLLPAVPVSVAAANPLAAICKP